MNRINGTNPPEFPRDVDVDDLVVQINGTAKPLEKAIIEPEDETENDKTIRNLLEKFDAYRDWKNAYWLPLINAGIRAYYGLVPPDTGPYKHVYITKEIFRQVQAVKPHITRQLISEDDSAQGVFKPVLPEFVEQAQAATSTIRQQIKRYGMNVQTRKWVEDACGLYGTSYLGYGWRTFKFNALKINPKFEEGTGKEIWQRDTTEEYRPRPYVEAIPVWEIFTDPSVEDVQDSPCVFRRQIVSTDALKTMVREGYLDAAAVEEEISEGVTGNINQNNEDRPDSIVRFDELFRGGKVQPLHDLITCHVNDGRNMEYCILNRRKIVRAAPCKYHGIPIINLRYCPQTGLHFGIPLPYVLLDDQKLLNDILSAWVASMHFASVPMNKVKPSAAKRYRNASFRPGGFIECDNPMEDIVPLQPSAQPMDLLGAAQFVLGRQKSTSSVTDEFAGSGGQSKTATQHVSLRDASTAIVEYAVVTFMPGFEKMYSALYNLNAMYLDEKTAVRMAGPDGADVWKYVKPNSFEADVDVEIQLANAMESGPEAANKWQNAYKLCGQDPRVKGDMILERIFRAMGEQKPKSFLASVSQTQQDAFKAITQWEASGIVADAQPSDNHQIWVQALNMYMATPRFQGIAAGNPFWGMRMGQVAAQHQQFLMEMMQANQQAQMASTTDPAQGAILPQANQRADAMFNIGDMGVNANQGGM